MNTRYVVFLNGPPRSGKDTCAELAATVLADQARVNIVKFAQPLRDAVAGLFGWSDAMVERGKADSIGTNFTVRDLMIKLSEEVVKPNIDRDFFGRRVGDIIAEGTAHITFVTDAGFDYEVEACIDTLRQECPDMQFALWQLRRTGTSFDGDSRSYIKTPVGVKHWSIVNNWDQEDLRWQVQIALNHLLGDMLGR